MENILGTVINWFTGKGKGKGEGESTSTECPLCETLGRTCAAHSRSSKGKGKPKVVLTDLTNEQRKVLKEYLGEEYEEVMDLLAGDQDQLNKVTAEANKAKAEALKLERADKALADFTTLSNSVLNHTVKMQQSLAKEKEIAGIYATKADAKVETILDQLDLSYEDRLAAAKEGKLPETRHISRAELLDKGAGKKGVTASTPKAASTATPATPASTASTEIYVGPPIKKEELIVTQTKEVLGKLSKSLRNPRTFSKESFFTYLEANVCEDAQSRVRGIIMQKDSKYGAFSWLYEVETSKATEAPKVEVKAEAPQEEDEEKEFSINSLLEKVTLEPTTYVDPKSQSPEGEGAPAKKGLDRIKEVIAEILANGGPSDQGVTPQEFYAGVKAAYSGKAPNRTQATTIIDLLTQKGLEALISDELKASAQGTKSKPQVNENEEVVITRPSAGTVDK